jgi:hypothetical protein
MRVKKVVINNGIPNPNILIFGLGNRLYRLAEDLIIYVYTNEGVLIFKFRKGFVTNFRSGGMLVDGIIDQLGNVWMQAAYLCHDAAYTPCFALDMEHPISREFADEVLKGMLLFAGMGKFKASLVYNSVRVFGSGAYEEDDELTEANSKLFTFTWRAA